MQLQEGAEPGEAVAGRESAWAVRNGGAGYERSEQDGPEAGEELRVLQAIE